MKSHRLSDNFPIEKSLMYDFHMFILNITVKYHQNKKLTQMSTVKYNSQTDRISVAESSRED